MMGSYVAGGGGGGMVVLVTCVSPLKCRKATASGVGGDGSVVSTPPWLGVLSPWGDTDSKQDN